MNKLIIIGNGFDLAHGLKTRYSDFLVWYFNQVFKEHKSSGNFEDSLVKIDGEYPITILFRTLEDFTNHLRDGLSFKLKYKSDFFRDLVYKFGQNNWVDIESDYYSRLVGIYMGYEHGQILARDLQLKALAGFNEHFNSIKEKLIEYLSTIQISDEIYNHEIESKLENIFYDPERELTEKNKEDKILILNFNYTNTIDLYTKVIRTDLKKEKIYIHGQLNHPTNPIIFGYGDEMDPHYEKIENLNNNEFLKNIKSFSYFKTDNYQRFLRFVDSSQYKVYVLGHSCGISDRILLNNIFEHDNCQAIKIYYHQRSTSDTDFFEKTQEISRHFQPQNKSLMRKRIVSFPDCSPLT